MSAPLITMQEIAVRAGVSRMTVSLALRNSSRIPPATRERIQAIADSLGYRPDPLIQRLTTHLGQGRRRSDGQVIAWIDAWKVRGSWRALPGFLLNYQGALARAEQLGFRLEEFWLRQPGMTGRKLSRILYQRGIECVLGAPIPHAGGHITMDWEKFSSVAIGYSMAAPQLNRVVNHELHSAREAIRNLYRRGYRRIGLCIQQALDTHADHSWVEAIAYHQFRAAHENRVRPLIQAQFTEAEVLKWVEKERPDSILIHGSWLCEIFKNAGFRIPQDFAVVLLDWPDRTPEMAGIDQRHEIVGQAAVDLVVGQAYRNEKGIPEVPRTVMIEGMWVNGTSLKDSKRG